MRLAKKSEDATIKAEKPKTKLEFFIMTISSILIIFTQLLPDFIFSRLVNVGQFGLIVSLALMVVKSLLKNQISKTDKILEFIKKERRKVINWLKSRTWQQLVFGVGFILSFAFTCVALFVPEVSQYQEVLYTALSLLGSTATAGIVAGRKVLTEISAIIPTKEEKRLEKQAKEIKKLEDKKLIEEKIKQDKEFENARLSEIKAKLIADKQTMQETKI